MVDKKIGLDLDDLNGDKKKEEVVETEIVPTNITIAIKRGPNTFLMRDLAYCSPDEFVEWVTQVFPECEPTTLQPKDFVSRHTRLMAFEQIVQHRSKEMFPRTNPPPKK